MHTRQFIAIAAASLAALFLGVAEGDACHFGTNISLVYNAPRTELIEFQLNKGGLTSIVCQAVPDTLVTYTLYHCKCEKGDPSPEMDRCIQVEYLVTTDVTIFDDIHDMEWDQGCIFKSGGGGVIPSHCSRTSNSTGCEPTICGTGSSGTQQY